MVSAALSLDAIVTAIACLCSTTNVREEQVSTLLRFNNHTIPKAGFWDQSNQLKIIEERLTSLESKLERISKLLEASQPQQNFPNIANCENLNLKEHEVKGIDFEIPGMIPFIGVCKNVEHRGNWLVIQRRLLGDVNFVRNWANYKMGFGRVESDYFIGLERLHQITKERPHQLLINMRKELIDYYFIAHYDRFEIDSEQNGYALKVLGKYQGTAGDSLNSHRGFKFSTYDNDNDPNPDENYAEKYFGAWWFGNDFKSHLNGKFAVDSIGGIIWSDLTSYNKSLAYVEMLIKPVY